MRRDEVEAAWNWVDPILRGWGSYYRKPRPYPAGEDGPEQAHQFIERQGHRWWQ
jgi:glucose-6-phosphate 1-dehydrogenase